MSECLRHWMAELIQKAWMAEAIPLQSHHHLVAATAPHVPAKPGCAAAETLCTGASRRFAHPLQHLTCRKPQPPPSQQAAESWRCQKAATSEPRRERFGKHYSPFTSAKPGGLTGKVAAPARAGISQCPCRTESSLTAPRRQCGSACGVMGSRNVPVGSERNGDTEVTELASWKLSAMGAQEGVGGHPPVCHPSTRCRPRPLCPQSSQAWAP